MGVSLLYLLLHPYPAKIVITSPVAKYFWQAIDNYFNLPPLLCCIAFQRLFEQMLYTF